MTPEGWRAVRLGDAVTLVGGGTPSRENASFWNGGIPWATPTDVTSLVGRYIERTASNISTDGLAGSSAKLLPAGSVLMTSRATIGRCAINRVEMATNQGFQNLVPGTDVDAPFLLYVIAHRVPELVSLAAGSTFLEISRRSVASLALALPPLREQRKIAAILSSVDDAIEATQAVIEQLQVVKKAMMAELLTRGLPGRHTRFKMTEIGEVPEAWEVVKLGDVVVEGPTNGVYKPASQIGRGALVAGMTAIEGSTLSWRLCRRAELTESEIGRFGLRPGDLLVTRVYARVDGIGRFILVPETTEPVGYESNMMRIRVARARALPEFVATHMALSDLRREIEQRATLGAQASINNEGVRSLSLRLPPLQEQEEISAALRALDVRLERELAAQEQLKVTKTALSTVLLTGEVRVRPNEETA